MKVGLVRCIGAGAECGLEGSLISVVLSVSFPEFGPSQLSCAPLCLLVDTTLSQSMLLYHSSLDEWFGLSVTTLVG